MRYFLEIVLTVLVMATSLGAQRQGDLCVVTENNQPGVCRHFSDCPGTLEAAFQGKPPQVCASPENKLVVCCPWVPGQETGLEASCQANSTTPREGDNCTMVNTGKPGVCSRYSNCRTAIEAASKGILPQTCDVAGNIQIVCCPMSTVVEGYNCTMVDTGRAGVCKPFVNCQSAKEAAYKGIFQQKCDLTDNESELVCCTKTACPALPKGLVTQLPIGSKAADYCIELAEKIHPCQETRTGWTRGNMCPQLTPDMNIEYHHTPITTTADAPYYGRVGSGQRGAITWRGFPVSLVSDQWVLCAAWFIEEIGSDKVQFVGLGGTFTPRYTPDETYGVTKQYIHPLYNRTYSLVYNDIALLRLDREVKFTARILPACLHTGTPLPDSGFIFTTSINASTENKRSMQRISQDECSRVLPPGSSYHPTGVKHDVEICSRPVNTTGGCWGWYSGSPLTLLNSPRVACTHLLVGLGSWHKTSPCTHINTRISGFITWIEGIVWPENAIVV